MTRPDRQGDSTSSIENLRELQLRALLNDLIHELGPVRAAQRLGVDRKTLWRSGGVGQMTPRLVEALERMLLERVVADMEDDRARVKALESRVAELEEQLGEAVAGGDNGKPAGDADSLTVKDLRDEFGDGLQRLMRRVDRLETAQVGKGPNDNPGLLLAGSQRLHDGLVKQDPAEGDEDVYGAAWPLVEEWRGLWGLHSPTGRGLAWASTRERILELELAMLEGHGLTLPPETAPLGSLERREQVSWRIRELAAIQRHRQRLELLRRVRQALTPGLWRR